MSKKPYLFVLKGIEESIPIKHEEKHVTKISDLTTIDNFVSFLDENKKIHNYLVTMVDHNSRECLPEATDIRCFWDHEKIDTIPIGCPIRYLNSQIEKTYTSEVTKDKYTIKENINIKTKKSIRKGDYNNRSKIKVKEKDYYETDGIFCSFNCALAFINDKKNDPMYSQSEFLLHKMYLEIFGLSSNSICPSPSFRVLDKYGGFQSIKDFRKNLNKIEYGEFGIIKNLPKCHPIGFLFEERVKF